jgi:spoIIIJ-associated protein
VEWVETTGRTIEDAKEAALDELGVDESDAEFEVLEEARAGLFGRLRSEARVRARVRPTAPRAKEDRRDRRRRNRSGADEGGRRSGSADDDAARRANGDKVAPSAAGESASAPATAGTAAAATGAAITGSAAAGDSTTDPSSKGSHRSGSRRRSGRRPGDEGRPTRPVPDAATHNDNEHREGSEVEVALDEQGRIAEQFLTELTAEFGVEATVEVVRPDEDTVDLHLRGSDLGLLIGPKGSTLLAIQDLTRTVVHHQTGAGNGRIHVDVGGYRQKRSEALARFAQQVAASVKQNGTRTVLEPMSAADRKVVHDAITSIEGVSTISEGEEPRRRVVVLPAEH